VLAAKEVKEKLERKKRSQEKDYARFQPNLNLPQVNASHNFPPFSKLMQLIYHQ
jgi:hypothetical protein